MPDTARSPGEGLTASLAAHHGDYGYDAPVAPFGFAAGALVFGVLAIMSGQAGERRSMWLQLATAAFFALNAASFLYTTRRGKFIAWAGVIGGMALRGDEQVLDLGCGRGAVLTMVGRVLTGAGRVTGIDIWNTRDQSGSSEDACRRNAALEGVADRVVLHTGDMRTLPFADETFDLIVSSLAIHNISSTAGRAQAIAQAARVLAPGGRLFIADIRHAARYASELRQLKLVDVTTRSLGWRFWYGNPIAATTLVTARKPDGVRPG